ncbi:MAG: YybH family protein [Chitinophagaceae bacterium]
MKFLLTALLAFITTTISAQKSSDTHSHIDNDGKLLKIQLSANTDKGNINYKKEFDVKGMSQIQIDQLIDHIKDSLGFPNDKKEKRSSSSSQSSANKELWQMAEKFNAQQVDAFNKGNLLGVANFYSDDAMIYHPGKIYKGRESINNYWTDIKDGKSWKLTIKEVGGNKNSFWVAGLSELTALDKGIERTFASNYIVIMQPDKNGNYKIYKDIYNQAPKQ